MVKAIAVAILACLLSGCVTYSAGIAPSTKPLDPDEYTVLANVEGSSWGVNILGIPIKQASTADALSEAIKGADALIQVSVDNRDYYLALVWLQRIRVQGMSVKESVRVKKE